MENKRLLIKKPLVIHEPNEVVVHNVLVCGTEEYDLQSRMSEETYQYADIESVADYVVAGCLRLAIMNEFDIESDFPISEEFGWKVSNFLDSIYSDSSVKKRKIHVNVPTTPYKVNWNKTHVATGLSCGVDSLYSINRYANRREWGGVNTLLNYDVTDKGYGRISEQRAKLTESFAKEEKYSYWQITTNLLDIWEKIENKPYEHVLYHLYSAAFVILMFQKSLSKYYYSSTYSYREFELNINEDPSHYELLLTRVFSVNGLEIWPIGGEVSRLQKVKSIATYKPSFKYLNVCVADSKNEMHCFKCVRTLLELDAAGSIDKYGAVFDLDYYYKNRDTYLFQMWEGRKTDVFLQEVWDVLKGDVTCRLIINEWIKKYVRKIRNRINKMKK